MKQLWIELVNTGIANRFEFDDYELIEMNWRLTKYPKLYHTVFLHEVNHQGGGFKPEDFIHDMKSSTPGIFKFMTKHISAWTQVLPFYWDRERKQLVYDIFSIFSWVMVVGIAMGLYFFMRWLL